MINRERTFFAVLLALLLYPGDNLGRAFQPEFVKPLANLTIPVGRDAIFTCHVEHLGGYRVGWVKADTKAIQAIHEHVITHNPRVSVSHGDHSSWSLRIKGAQKEDEGLYMCQINTDPMKFQTGMLTVDVPPDFHPEMTSGDVMVREGERVQLQCRATGIPQPRVTWRREDQKEIIIREPFSDKSTGSNEKLKVYKVTEWTGEQLNLTKIKRDQMGVYNCLASNGVPPSISKRIIVDVQFPPVIHVPNQLVGAPLGTNVTLECIVEASPQSINFWLDNKDAMIMSSARHEAQVVTKTPSKSHPNFNYKVKMLLKIHNFTKQDIGTYKCAAKNSLGDYESSIRLYDITNAVKHNHPSAPAYIEPSPIDQNNRLDSNSNNNNNNHNPDQGNDAIDEAAYGSVSAELDHVENGRPLPLDNTVQGQIGSVQLSTPASSVRVRGKRPNGSHQQYSAADKTTESFMLLLVLLMSPPSLLLMHYGR